MENVKLSTKMIGGGDDKHFMTPEDRERRRIPIFLIHNIFLVAENGVCSMYA